MSPDPGSAGAKLSAPQSWNAYSYVQNNPTNAIDPDGLECIDYTGGNFPTAVPVSSFQLNCGDTPTPPPAPSSPQGEKSKLSTDPAFDPSTPGSVTGGSQPDLRSMKGQYFRDTTRLFQAVHCAAKNDPTDPGCWGYKLTLKGGMFQGSWSLDVATTTAEKSIGFQPLGLPGTSPVTPPPDPLDPSQLPNLQPGPLSAPTARTYTCSAIARELGFQSGSPQNLAALRTLYQTKCR